MSIAVIIPAYNAASFLAETLESVLRQTLPADEILVIDDGSTDDTAAIAESFPPPVRVFRRKNARQAASRNFGAAQATSEWIAFQDADDLWEENKLERQMEELARNPAASLCYTGRVKFTMENGAMRFGSVIPGPPVSEIANELFHRCTFLPSTVLMRKSAFLDAGGFRTTFKITEDWDMWLRLLHRGIQFASCPEPLLLYRMHGSSVSAQGLTLLEENIGIFREHVLPHLSGVARLRAINRFYGENQAFVAYGLGKQHDPRCIPLMAKSILHLPFEEPYRYRALAGMVLARLTGRMKPRP